MATAITGHCSQCHRVWTLDKPSGVCQWCGKSATCQSGRASRAIKPSRPHKQAEPHDTGYDQLTGDYATYNKVASRFAHKAMPEDTEDLLHDIIYHLAKVHQNKRNRNEPLTEAMMYRIASHIKDHYWYSHYKLNNGLDCQHCSKAQRHKCKEDWLYTECPKAIKIEDLHKPIIDSEGNITELGDLIADDKALDLDAWVDARLFLIGAPQRLKGIAVKLRDGEQLTGAEKVYLHKWRRREQKSLF